MKFSVTQANLVKGLQIVNRIATTRSTLPILGNILLTTDGGRLKLVSTDLELAIDTYIGAKVEIEGAITVPARTFTEFVTNNNDETIDFTLKDTVLHAKSQHFTAEMKGIDASEFPTVPPISSEQTITMVAPDLKAGIGHTVFASANDETRPILGGVAFAVKGESVTLAATDSYRLAEKKIKVQNPASYEGTAIVPARTLTELNRLITDEHAQVTFTIDKHQIAATVGDTHIVSRLIDGTFPAYESIIPQKLETSATLNRQEFIASLKMASLFARDAAYNVTFVVSEKEVTLKALSAAIGASTSTVVASVTGPEVTIAFNARFFIDALSVMSGEAVQFQVSPPADNHWFPGVLTSTTDLDYQYIIMPLRTE